MASQITSLTIVYSIVYSRRRSKKTSKLRVIGLCEGNSPVTGEFPAQMASNAKNVSTWWRHHGDLYIQYICLFSTSWKQWSRTGGSWCALRSSDGFSLGLFQSHVSGQHRLCTCCIIHYNDVKMSAMASQITSLTIVYSTDADQRKHQSSALLAFVRGIPRWPTNFPHKRPVTRKMFSFDDASCRWAVRSLISSATRWWQQTKKIKDLPYLFLWEKPIDGFPSQGVNSEGIVFMSWRHH